MRLIIVCPELFKIMAQRPLSSGIERCERAVGRAIIHAEKLDHRHRRKGIAHRIEALRGIQPGDSVLEPLADYRLVSPLHRRCHERWRRDVLADDFSLKERAVRHLADGVKPSNIEALVDLIVSEGTKTIWH